MAIVMKISVVPYNDGMFDVILVDVETNREVVLSGTQEISGEEFELLNKLAPSCVWTKYQQI